MFEIYEGKRVLVTGHTGFTGSWLCQWLKMLGAEVIGYGHPPRDTPNHHELLGNKRTSVCQDLLHSNMLDFKMETSRPELVIHLAAKGIVARTITEPHETFHNNIMGAVNILEACRITKGVKGIVMAQTDKVYEIRNTDYAYKESDTLGGADAYSCSKVCVEHIIRSYRESYGLNIATARAGNIIGGGDWTWKRLFPDIVKATVKGEKVVIRTPSATRPWQHALEAIHGYLLLGQNILEGKDVNRAWNFGPDGAMTVLEVMQTAKEVWDKVDWVIDESQSHPAMNYLLNIDSTLSKKKLGWYPRWTTREAVERTIAWYENYYDNGLITTTKDIMDFMEG